MTYKLKYREAHEMKDSGVEWLGKIPKDWEITKIKFVSNLIMGQSPSSNEVNQSELGTPFLQGKMEFGKKYPKAINYCLNPKKKSRINDVLVSVRAPVGEINVSDIEYCIGRGLAAIQSNSHDNFLYYALLAYKDALISYSTGSTFKAISINQIENLYMIDPNYLSQIKISNFLDIKISEFDSIISKKELLIEKLEKAKISLISEMVTGKVEIVDGALIDRKTHEMKDSGVEWLGMIPKNWDTKKIKYLLENSKNSLRVGPFGSSLKGDDFNGNFAKVYTQRNVLDKNLESGNDFITKAKYSQMLGFKVFPSDILITTRGTIGKIIRMEKDYHIGIIHPTIIKFRIPEKNYNYALLEIIFNQSDIINNQIKLMSNATTIDVIYSYTLKNITIPYMALLEQNEMTEYLKNALGNINSITNKIKLQIKKLKEAKQSLISEAVTGKIDLRDWEIEEV